VDDEGADYVLTAHARDALEKRQIQRAWLERAYYSPEAVESDPVDSDLEQRLARILERGDRVLRVVVNVAVEPNRIITVFFEHRRVIS
jgi:hypothetical protein